MSTQPETQNSKLETAVLTAREREVLAAVASGFSSKMIADQMGISIHTVKVHRAHVYFKLGVRSVGEAVRLWLTVSSF